MPISITLAIWGSPSAPCSRKLPQCSRASSRAMAIDMDAIVVGSGPNGLVAAAELARHGWRVLVLEAQNRPGGALYSLETTLPGYLHDVGAAFFPFAQASPAFRALDLTGAGLQWGGGRFESCHPAPDGTCVSIA